MVLMSPDFDFPARAMPPNVRFVGTPLDEEARVPWVPPWSVAGASRASWSVSARCIKVKRRSWSAFSPRWQSSRCAPS